ncbi:MAG: hypothetical protein ACI4JB_02165 [Porcipelethomonas sp.]
MKITEKYVPGLILSIVLIFSLIGTGAAAIAKFYLLDESTYIENSDENNIPQKALEEIGTYFKNSEDYSGIPESVYMSAISEDDVKKLIDMKIENVFDYIKGLDQDEDDLNAELDFSSLEKSISDYFNEFAEENNVEIDDAYKNQLQNTIDTAESEISSFTDIYMLSLIGKTGAISKTRSLYSYLDIIMYICGGLALLCIVLIAVFMRKNIKNALYWISISLICASVLALIPTLCLKISGFTDRLIISNRCIYDSVTAFLSGTLTTLIVCELILLVIGAVLIITSLLISRKKNK